MLPRDERGEELIDTMHDQTKPAGQRQRGGPRKVDRGDTLSSRTYELRREISRHVRRLEDDDPAEPAGPDSPPDPPRGDRDDRRRGAGGRGS
jgi:hypothetical protein